MKKLKIFFVLLLAIFITGCSFNDLDGRSDSLIVLNSDKVLDKYEKKELQEGVSYKEIVSKTVNGEDLLVDIIIYNDTDKDIRVSGIVQGYLGSEKSVQTSQAAIEYISAHSAYPLGFYLLYADNYKINNLIVESGSRIIEKDAYTFEDYKITEEELSIYFKYNSNGVNGTKVKVLGFRDGDYVYRSNEYINYVNDNYVTDYFKDITKSGERGGAIFEIDTVYDIQSGLTFNDIDKFVYFVSGYYRNY